ISNGYGKIVEASNLPDAKLWINKYKNKNDYGAEEAKILLYRNEYDNLMQDLIKRYEKEKNKHKYVQLGLAKNLIRRKMHNKAQLILNKIRNHQNNDIYSQVNSLNLQLKNYE
ncbi:6752_t:CDS:1, partial [Dentiscutata heterogama]